jgi:GNAT superfamily N-acetyltransferase
MTHRVVALGLDDIMALRVRVLRQGTPTTHCNYPEDNYPNVVHLGIVDAGDVIATSTWFTKPCPEHSEIAAMQLKGMAVDASRQIGGLGRAVIDAGIAHAQAHGAQLVWARARDSALQFYLKCGFNVAGEGFIDEPTGMPHHIVVRSI